jgi:hypothetical protein
MAEQKWTERLLEEMDRPVGQNQNDRESLLCGHEVRLTEIAVLLALRICSNLLIPSKSLKREC